VRLDTRFLLLPLECLESESAKFPLTRGRAARIAHDAKVSQRWIPHRDPGLFDPWINSKERRFHSAVRKLLPMTVSQTLIPSRIPFLGGTPALATTLIGFVSVGDHETPADLFSVPRTSR
jgi:hypothetical protein